MKMLEAMRETVELMDSRMDANGRMHAALINESLAPAHIREMLATMESGVNPQDTESGFSDGKMGRWLGWAQAAVVAMGLSSLNEMKEINRRWAE